MLDICSDLTQQCASFGGHDGPGHIAGKIEKLGRLLQMEAVKVC